MRQNLKIPQLKQVPRNNLRSVCLLQDPTRVSIATATTTQAVRNQDPANDLPVMVLHPPLHAFLLRNKRRQAASPLLDRTEIRTRQLLQTDSQGMTSKSCFEVLHTYVLGFPFSDLYACWLMPQKLSNVLSKRRDMS